MAGSTIRWACCGRCLSRWRSTCYSRWPAWRCAGAGAGRAGGWAHRRGPLYRLASQGEAGAYLYGYAACFDAIAMGCCAAVLARRGRFAVLGRPAARDHRRGHGGLYLAWPIGQSNVRWARPRWRSARPCCWRGHGVKGACPALARAGRLWSAQLRDLPLPPGGAGPDRGWAPPALASGDARVALLAVYLAASCAAGWLVARWWSEPANAALRLHTRA